MVSRGCRVKESLRGYLSQGRCGDRVPWSAGRYLIVGLYFPRAAPHWPELRGATCLARVRPAKSTQNA